MMIKRLKRITALILCISIIPISAYADTVDKLEQSTMNVIYLLKDLYQAKYAETEENIKELIKRKDYDYNLSMDTFYDQPNPFNKADSIRIISAYMTCKNHSNENIQISTIPFIDYTAIEHRFEQYIPTKIDHYYKTSTDSEVFFKYGFEYILEPQSIPKYEEISKNRYKKTDETEEIVPDTEERTFIEITLHIISPEDIFKRFGISMEEYEDEYETRIKALRRITTNECINQTVTLSLPTFFAVDGTDYTNYIRGLSGNRSHLVQTALSLRNRVPYEWGGKSTKPGYDTKWWSYNEENGLQKGLDCSGFVQWTYRTAGFGDDVLNNLISTSTILAGNLPEIQKETLLPGDIGCTNNPAGRTNHTGIYLGNNLWIHCSSGKRTVTVSEYGFTKFYSVADEADTDVEVFEEYAGSFYQGIKQEINVDTDNLIDYTHKYDDNDIILISKVISNEARGEGINGWIAVAETVLNRVESDKFPNTVEEVVLQKGQFSGTEHYDNVIPTEEMKTVAEMVANGSLTYLNNPEVLYFRNPMITDNIPATDPVDWAQHKYYTAIGNHAFYVD